MSDNNRGNRKGLDKRIVLFFVFAVLCVAAFLIVMLVKSCDAYHEEENMDKEMQQEEIVMIPASETINLFS